MTCGKGSVFLVFFVVLFGLVSCEFHWELLDGQIDGTFDASVDIDVFHLYLTDHKIVFYKNSIILFGGYGVRGINMSYNSVLRYHINSSNWVLLWGDLVGGILPSYSGEIYPGGIRGYTMVLRADDLIVFGGIYTNGTSNDVWKFNIVSSKWSLLTGSIISPPPLHSHASDLSADGNRMYVYGGYSSGIQEEVWEYNFLNNQWSLRNGCLSIENSDIQVTISEEEKPESEKGKWHTLIEYSCAKGFEPTETSTCQDNSREVHRFSENRFQVIFDPEPCSNQNGIIGSYLTILALVILL